MIKTEERTIKAPLCVAVASHLTLIISGVRRSAKLTIIFIAQFVGKKYLKKFDDKSIF